MIAVGSLRCCFCSGPIPRHPKLKFHANARFCSKSCRQTFTQMKDPVVEALYGEIEERDKEIAYLKGLLHGSKVR